MITGEAYELEIEPDYTVEKIKELIGKKENILTPQLRLVLGGRQMSDDKTASDYKLEEGSLLHLILALRGGGED
jgi:ubiquitin-like protein Nedd8